MRILLVKTSAIGDVVQAFPVLEYLRKRFPEAELDWVVEKPIAELVASHPDVNRVLLVDTKKWRKNFLLNWREIRAFSKKLKEREYDLLFDLQGNSKSALFTWMARAKVKVGYGFKTVPEFLAALVTHRKWNPPSDLNIRLQYLHLVKSYFQDQQPFERSSCHLKVEERVSPPELGRPLLMVCFGSRWRNKQLPQESLIQLLEQIQAKWSLGFLFIYGNREEKELAHELQRVFAESSAVLGNLTLQQLQNLMREVDALFSMDSAPLHLCGTTETPSFSLFGPSLANRYKPLGEHHGFFQGSCPYGQQFSKRCPILRTCKTGACIRELDVEAIFNAFEAWFSKKKGVAHGRYNS